MKKTNLNVVLALHDKNGEYSKFAATTIISIFENMKIENRCNVTIHILHDKTLTYNNRNKFIELLNNYNANIKFHEINIMKLNFTNEVFEKLQSVTIGALFRLFIPQIFSDMDEVLYLDTDIIVNCDLIEMIQDINLTGYFIASVLDDEKTRQNYINTNYYRTKGVDYKKYFNSGVILFNIKEINKNMNFLKKAINLLDSKLFFVDQDILNIIFRKKVYFLDYRFNLLIDFRERSVDEINELLNKKAILHFAGYFKPWNCDNQNVIKNYFSYMLLSPWVNNKQDIVNIMSDIAFEYNKKLNLKNCLKLKKKETGTDNIFLLLKLFTSNQLFFKLKVKIECIVLKLKLIK